MFKPSELFRVCFRRGYASQFYRNYTINTSTELYTLRKLNVSAAYNFIAASSTANFSRKPWAMFLHSSLCERAMFTIEQLPLKISSIDSPL